MENFWQEFKLKPDCTSTIKIIVGQEPYKQSLANIDFSVTPNNSSVPIYNDLNNIAFLVSNWIKIQDSLEMIFNLLFGRKRSLEAICFLKGKDISAQIFAESLWDKAKVILVNRNTNGQDRKKEIVNFAKQQSLPGQFLFVGNKSADTFTGIPNNYKSAIAIHPSGANLNKPSLNQRYTDNWLSCIGEQLQNEDSNFNYNAFKLLR